MSEPTNTPDPYAEGAEAFYSGKSVTANPYDLKTQETEHLSWNDGYWDAESDEAASAS